MAAAYRGAEGLLRPPATAPQRPSPAVGPGAPRRRQPLHSCNLGNTARTARSRDGSPGLQLSQRRQRTDRSVAWLKPADPEDMFTCDIAPRALRGIEGGGEEQSKEGMHMEREEATVHALHKAAAGRRPNAGLPRPPVTSGRCAQTAAATPASSRSLAYVSFFERSNMCATLSCRGAGRGGRVHHSGRQATRPAGFQQPRETNSFAASLAHQAVVLAQRL